VPASTLPHFDGTNFAKWKHLMRNNLIIFTLIFGRLCAVDFSNLKIIRVQQMISYQLSISTSKLQVFFLSALDGNEYNHVINVDVEKQIWDTLHLAHEGVDKVRSAKIDWLMAKLNRFVIVDEEGPHKCLLD
jgi:hypothetical protein